ncbi:ubiquitin-specific protease ubp2, partial [Modicella reniformis]
MAKLNAAFRPEILNRDNKPEDRFNSLFYVKAHRNSTEQNKENGKTVVEHIPEDFSTLLLSVANEDITMEELIDDYFDPSEREAGNKAESDDGGTSNTSEGTQPHRNITATVLPPVLQIHLMRTRFDRSFQTSYKSNTRVSIPKRLYMDQYLEPNQEENSDRIKRIRLWKEERSQCRQALGKIRERREVGIS